MKKRILSVLLVVAMLATMMVMPVYAADNATVNTKTHCPHCNTPWAELEVKELTQDELVTTTLDSEGQEVEVMKELPLSVEEAADSEGNAYVHYKLITDITDGKDLIKVQAGATAVLDVNGKTIAQTATGKRAIYINGADKTIYLLDSSNQPGKVTTTTKSVGGAAMNISGTVYLYDITVNGTTQTTFQNDYGACVGISGTGKVIMYSGVINGAKSTTYKKNSTNYGTNQAPVKLTGAGATFEMYGGTINVGKENYAITNRAHNAVNSVTVKLNGGTVNGKVYLEARTNPAITVSGNPVIKDLDLTSCGTVTLDATKPLTDGASIGVTAAADTAFTAAAADEAAAKALATKFYSNVDGKNVRFNDAFALVLTEGNPYRDCPHCGQIVEFAPYTYESGKSMTKAGHYYLVDVVVTTSEVGIGSTDGDLVLDLSGKSITKKFRAFSIRKNTKVFMFDSVGGSVVTGGHTAENRIGSCIYMNPADKGSSTELTLYSGTYRWYKEGAENLANGGVIYCSGGCELTVTGDAVVTGGKTAGNGGNICAVGNSEVTISGNAKVYGGQAAIGADIYTAGILNIAETVTGEMKLGFPSGAIAYGEAIANTVYGAGELNKDLKLTLDITRDRATPIEVISTVTEVEGEEPVTKYQLSAVIGTIAVTDGVQTWYDNAADAVAADADYIKACGQDIKLASDAIVDINGSNVALTADAAVTAYCFDSANNDYYGSGSVTADANVTVKSLDESNAEIAEATAANYIVLENEGAYSVHALDMDVSAIGLKTASNGMYYYANYKCDDILKAEILSYGIEYALYDENETAPIAGTTTQVIEIENDGEGALVTKKDIAIGGMNGVIGSDINGYTDAECGKMKIMATPVIAVGDQVISGATVGYSMFDCCQAVYDMIAACNAAGDTETAARYTELMNNLFTQTWAEYELDSWVFENVPETVA